MKTENKNFILNAAYQLLTYVFPLITVSYVSRSLGVDNVGIYSYTYSIVYMFMLVAMLGINNYGNRSVAKVRDDKEALSKEFFSIYNLQLIISCTVLFVYILYLIFICKEYKWIATIQTIQMISVLFDINWFYFGLEKFKITITRNFMIKIGSMVLIFLFVKNPSDLWKYTLIMSGSILASQLYLVLNLRKYVFYVRVNLKESLKHLKSIVVLFIPVLAFGIYRVMDKTMIGSLSSVTELGYYENAERLINIPISLITALGTVMLPRMAYLFKDENYNCKLQIQQSMKLALLMSTVMAGGLYLIADDISIIMFGNSFAQSGNIVKALCITIIASAWANVIRTQYLIPKAIDKVYVNSTIGGAIVNLLFNILLIGKYGASGACVGTVAAELFVAVYQTVKTRKTLDPAKYLLSLLVYTVKTIVVMYIAFVIGNRLANIYLRVSVYVVIALIGFVILNYKYLVYDFLGIKKKN